MVMPAWPEGRRERGSAMNEPKKHHYIPQFYLSGWCASDGRVVYYRRVPGRVVEGRIAPRSTGFEENLYTLAHLHESVRQAVETEVTADVDNRASVALRKMTAARSAQTLTPDERRAWSQFIVSLPIRNPEAVADIKQTPTRSVMERAFATAKQQCPEWAGEGDVHAAFEGRVDDDHLSRFVSANYGLMIISELMRNPDYHRIILDMHWWVADLAAAGISLITADRPYKTFRSIRHPRCLIYVPIGPKLAFYASPDPNKKKQLLGQPPKFIVKTMNRTLAMLAAKFIYAADAQHGPLAAKWLSTR